MGKDKQKYTRDDGKDYYLWNLMVSILRMREEREEREKREKKESDDEQNRKGEQNDRIDYNTNSAVLNNNRS